MNRRKNNERTFKLVLTGMMAALIAALQTLSSFVKFGPFSITLALIPLVVGAAVLGVGYGAGLGALFGIMTYLFAVFGVDVGGNMLFVANPFLLLLLCVTKGALAGAAAGLICRVFGKKHPVAGSVTAAVSAPIVNTGVFLLFLFFGYFDILKEWAGGTDILMYIITGLCGVNFLVEVLVSAVLSPVVLAVMRGVGKKHY